MRTSPTRCGVAASVAAVIALGGVSFPAAHADDGTYTVRPRFIDEVARLRRQFD